MPSKAIKSLLLFFISLPLFAMAQDPNNRSKHSVPDSLHLLISKATNDSLRWVYYINVADYYLHSVPDSSVKYANKCLNEAQAKGNVRAAARAYTILGINLSNKGELKKALDYYFKSLKLHERINNQNGMAGNYNNIGLIFLNMGNYPLALEYYNKALNYHQGVGHKQNIADMYNNIGIVYCTKGSLDTCLQYMIKSIEIKKEIGDKSGLATSLDNVGQIYLNKGKKDEALHYFSQSLKYKEDLNDKMGLCITYLNLSEAAAQGKDFKKAQQYVQKELQLASDFNSKIFKEYGYQHMANFSYDDHDFKKAYEYHVAYTTVKDSILNEESNKSMQELQTSYESEKKDAEIKLLNKDNQVKQSDLKKQQILNWSIGAGFIIVLISSTFVFRSYRQKKKANVLLEEKNQAIHEQNLVISEKKKEIEDSINYARFIQQSILPEVRLFSKYFGENLLLFMPKDIVSGDFYFLQPSSDQKTIWLGAVDCTGHGVPGGFMSVIGAEVFTQGVEEGHVSPARVLAFTNKKIKQFLKQDQERSNSKDGMDAALCAIDADKRFLTFSGANRPLFLIRRSELLEFEPTKSSIGGITENTQEFKEHKIELQKGDCVYIFSDGYADQFGGERGKKLMTKNFKKMLLEIHLQPMETQKHLLLENIRKWRGNLEQVDDILVIGFRV